MKVKILVIFITSLFFITIFSTIPTIGIYSILESNKKLQSQSKMDDWWAMYLHDPARTAYSTSKGPDTNQLLWSDKINTDVEAWIITPPLVYNNKLYICTEEFYSDMLGTGKIYCINTENGVEIWSKTILPLGPSISFIHGAAVKDNRIYVVSVVVSLKVFTKLTIINAANGKIIKNLKFIDEIMMYPAIYDDKIYLQGGEAIEGGDGKLYCVDLNGNMIWNTKLPNIEEPISFAVSENRIFVSTTDDTSGIIYCLNADNGKQVIWQSQPYNKDIDLAVDNGKLFSVDSSAVRCFYANNGTEIWSYNYPGYKFLNKPAVYNEKVYIAIYNSNNFLNICCIDESGIKWTSQQISNYCFSTIVADGKVYSVTGGRESSGYVYCFNLESGNLIWNDYISELSHPIIANGKLHAIKFYGGIKTYGNNNAPNTPKISGSTKIKPGTEYKYNFIADDPNDDDVCFFVDWGDGTSEETDLYPSGTQVKVSHTWSDYGEYEIRAKAIDEHNAESEWSNPLQITTQKNKNINRPFLAFFQSFQNQFSILRIMLQWLGF